MVKNTNPFFNELELKLLNEKVDKGFICSLPRDELQSSLMFLEELARSGDLMLPLFNIEYNLELIKELIIMERKNLWGDKYVEFKKEALKKGYKYMVTYNPTENLWYFIDRCFKTLSGAERFYNKLLDLGVQNRKLKEIKNEEI